MSFGDGTGCNLRDISLFENEQSVEIESANIKIDEDPKRYYQIKMGVDIQ